MSCGTPLASESPLEEREVLEIESAAIVASVQLRMSRRMLQSLERVSWQSYTQNGRMVLISAVGGGSILDHEDHVVPVDDLIGELVA